MISDRAQVKAPRPFRQVLCESRDTNNKDTFKTGENWGLYNGLKWC